jgi:hypothetical protein
MTEDPQVNTPAVGWRFKIGIALFALSFVPPLFGIPLLAMMDLSTTITATLSGVMLVGAEVIGLVSVAVMGKEGFDYIKSRVFGFFKRYGPPDEVSRGRYIFGLVLFTLPLLFGWAADYMDDLIPGFLGNEIVFYVGGDLMFLSSLFVLGGDFWDKLRSLFVHGARAVFPKPPG